MFPDGLNGLNDESRTKKITTQQWMMQRLLNIENKFALNKPFVFSCVCFLEQEQLRNRMNISFLKVKMTRPERSTFLQSDDAHAVFDGIPGSNKYMQKMKYDLIAKMEPTTIVLHCIMC